MIYYMTTEEHRHVKIGYTAALTKLRLRITAMQTGNPSELILIGTSRGGKKDEKTLHDRFSKYRLRGEWFLISGEIETYLASSEIHPCDISSLPSEEFSGQVMIYIKDQELMDSIRTAAESRGLSVSAYLIGLHLESVAQKELRKPANPEKIKSHVAKEPSVSQREDYVTAVRNKPTDISSEFIDEMIEEQKERIDGKRVYPDDPVPDESTYDPGEVADTPSTAPEVKKPVSENPGKKATVKKLQADIDGAKWGNAGKDFSKVTTANRGKGKKKGGL